MEHQEKCVPVLSAALAKYGGALDCSDLGTGKSYTAAFTAEGLCAPDKFIVVVCPKAVRPSWVRIFEAMGLPASRFVVVNYEKLKRGVEGVGMMRKDKKLFIWNGRVGVLVWDEAHKLRSPDITLNARMAIGAKLAGIPALFLSATLAESPAHLRTVGFALGLHDGKHFADWAMKHGCTFDPWGKLTLRRTSAALVMTRLNAVLFPEYGVRVRKKDIPGFPDNEILAEAFDFGPPEKINAIYEEMEEELAELAEKQEVDGKKVKDTAKAMVAQLRARQKVELLKVPGVADMVDDAVEEGMSVVVFCNFIATLAALKEKLQGHKIAEVRGGQSEAVRQAFVDSFNAGYCRTILVQIQSGGAGLSLHDTTGEFPRLALIFPCFSASDLRQSTGRIHRAGGKSKSVQKILFAAGSVEERVMAKLKMKLADLDLLNDADIRTVDTEIAAPATAPAEENTPDEDSFYSTNP